MLKPGDILYVENIYYNNIMSEKIYYIKTSFIPDDSKSIWHICDVFFGKSRFDRLNYSLKSQLLLSYIDRATDPIYDEFEGGQSIKVEFLSQDGLAKFLLERDA